MPITGDKTVPYSIIVKHKACKIKLIPAAAGTGMKAGSSLRTVLELAGYENMLSKIVGSNNKLNVALTTLKALGMYKHTELFTQASDDKKSEGEKESTEKKAAPKKSAPKAKKEPVKKETKKAAPKKATAKTKKDEKAAA